MLSSLSTMCSFWKLISPIALITLNAVAVCQAEVKSATQGDTTLQEHYDAALRFQKDGNLDKAAAEYRAFLADALGDLAASRAHAGHYASAASLLEKALALVPDSPELNLEYARTALLAGDFARAETIARDFLHDYPGDPQRLAQAHQILGRALLKMNRDQDARKELEAAVALDPSFENGYDLAVACLDLDDEKCATHLFSELETSFGDSPSIHMTFGRAYGNSDFAPLAVAEFRKAIAMDPRLRSAHYSLAAALLATGEDESVMLEVEAELRKELAISPNDFLTYAALGKVAATHGRYSEAEKYLRQATLLNPNNPDAFLYLGQMYFDTNRPDEAKAALRKAILLTKEVGRNRFQIQKAHFLLGRILMQEHKEGEAHSEMQIARSFANKGLSEDKGKLAGLLQNGSGTDSPSVSAGSAAVPTTVPNNADPAGERDSQAFEAKLTPAIADSYNNLGAIAATGSDYDSALKYFKRAAEWNPKLDGLDYNWGHAAFSASRFSDAVKPLSRYLSAHPDVSAARGALAISQFMTQDYSGCVATLLRATAETMSIPQMQYVYAESLVKTGQVNLGKKRLQALESTHPEIAEVHRGLGEVLELQGDRQSAVNELQNAVRLNANDSEAHYDLGKVELETGDATAAIPEIESAVRLLPTEPKFHRELASAYTVALRPADAEKELRIYSALRTSQAQPAETSADSHETKTP